VAGKRVKRRLLLRARAGEDVLEAHDHDLEVSAQAAGGSIDALEKAYAHVRRDPAIGSARYGHELNLPGLRCWPCTRYPYLVFYVELDDRIEVWRVLHARRDIPCWLQEDGESPSR
jgi:toxin ParE1/3/4